MIPFAESALIHIDLGTKSIGTSEISLVGSMLLGFATYLIKEVRKMLRAKDEIIKAQFDRLVEVTNNGTAAQVASSTAVIHMADIASIANNSADIASREAAKMTAARLAEELGSKIKCLYVPLSAGPK